MHTMYLRSAASRSVNVPEDVVAGWAYPGRTQECKRDVRWSDQQERVADCPTVGLVHELNFFQYGITHRVIVF